MARKNRASVFYRTAIVIAASLFFTTLALPFSPIRLSGRSKLIAAVQVVPTSQRPTGHFAEKPDQRSKVKVASSAKSENLDARMLTEYGAVLMAKNVVPPPHEMFSSDEEVVRWQANVQTSGGDYVLQTAAAEALNDAREEARAQNLDITPRDTDAAARDFAYTVKLWMSRVNPGLDHWVKKGRVSLEEAQRIRALPSRDQAVAVLELEKEGMFFSQDFSKSILCSVAPPGASQHLALLAFDVKEHQNSRVREILERHGWYQTVQRDEPHFTYLGVTQSELPSLGLKRKVFGHRVYWIPNPAIFDSPMELVARK